VNYLPPFDLIRHSVEIFTVRKELRVNLSYADFVRILRLMISGIAVNEEWYLAEYPDIAQVIRGARCSRRGSISLMTAFLRGAGHSRWTWTIGGICRNIPTSRKACALASWARANSISSRTAIERGGCHSRSRPYCGRVISYHMRHERRYFSTPPSAVSLRACSASCR
jgi:hypothetical protein